MVRAMTTLKPQLVRADTLDLQDHDAPSAKDHTRQPNHPSPYGYGPAAPHQARTLRQAEEEAYHQQKSSPRVSEDPDHNDFQSDHRFYDDRDDELDDEHSRHLHGTNGVGEHDPDHDHDFDDGDGTDPHDDDLDDDMMDKISSSPSIEDGKYSLFLWPKRIDSIYSGAVPASEPLPMRGIPRCVSAPTLCQADPISASHQSECHQAQAEANIVDQNEGRQIREKIPKEQVQDKTEKKDETPLGGQKNDFGSFTSYLLPENDPFLEDIPEQTEASLSENEDDWVDDDDFLQDHESSSEDDTDDIPFTTDIRFIDSGWGGECLREVEDIDFEFVYALHTFVATVEGQANATKGDTMVLLDDSNSYWWLVRVVKDSSIGYLPAEHIETPTERLARLNKHRNIDLSRTMLVDNAEKSKNPLKKAMRRRNAKSVAFAAPTYYEPSEYDWSDEEEEPDDSQIETSEDGNQVDEPEVAQDQQATSTTAPEPHEVSTATVNGIQPAQDHEKSINEEPSSPVKSAPEPDPVQLQSEEIISRSRKGVVRNTDSFFKDDTAETKKISLTPRLLRSDVDSNGSQEQDQKQRSSSETFDKMLASEEKPKDDRKKKEKKGMLSGLFKRKDKSGKNAKVDVDEPEKNSEEIARQSPQSKDSLDSLSNKPDRSPERRPSKLQKTPPSVVSPKASPTESRPPQRDFPNSTPSSIPPAPVGPAPAPPQQQPQQVTTLRKVEADVPETNLAPAPLQIQTNTLQTPNRFPSLTEKRSIFTPLTAALKSANHHPTNEAVSKPIYSKRAKERFAIDESESEDDSTPTAGPQSQAHRSISPLRDSQNVHIPPGAAIQVSPIDSGEDFYPRYGSNMESSSKSAPTDTVIRSSPQTTEVTPIESEPSTGTSKPSPSTATHTPSTSRSTPTWSDASLRNYMDSHQDIKDLLIIVHDKSNVSPVGPEHPLMTNLYSNERTKLAEMQSQLDSMLMTWMSRKNATLLSR